MQQLGLLLNRQQRNLKRLKNKTPSININTINTEMIIEILKKSSEKNMAEISALKYFCLNKTNIVSKFLDDKLDEAAYDLIISLSLSTSSLKILNKDALIINIGEPSDYLYIILKGKAALFGFKKYHIEVTGYEYFLLLNNLKKNHDLFLLEKTAAENNRIYPIDLDDINYLEKIVLKIYLSKKLAKSSIKYLEVILDKVGLKYSDFDLVPYLDMVEQKYAQVIESQKEEDWDNMNEDEKIEKYKKLSIYNSNDAWNYTLQLEKKIFESLNFIDIEMMKKYNYLTKVKDEEMIVYYKSEFLNEIEENEYFGNSEHNLYKNKVVALTNDLHIMCIKSDLYKDYVRRINSKVIGSQINFLLDNFYFHPLYKGFFEKYYFKYFELVEYKLRQIIVKENDPITHVYFIKSGSVKLTSTRSIAENHILIELIKNILLKSKKYNNNSNVIKLEMDNLYNNITNNLEYFHNDMNVKSKVHIMTLQSNNCIGSTCLHYGFNYLYTAEVNSEIVELYKIPVDKIMRILDDKTSKVFYYYGEYSENSLKLFFNRLTRVNNMLLTDLNKKKVRQHGDIFNLNVENYKDNIYKNDIKFTNKKDIFSFDTLFKNKKKEKSNSRNILKLTNENIDQDKMSSENKDINSNLFITQNKTTPYYIQLKSKIYSNAIKKNNKLMKEKEKTFNKDEDITQKIIDNLKRSNSLNLFPMPKDSPKDLTAHIKFFDYKENLEKIKAKEEIRAMKGLIRLEKKEKSQIEKLRYETKTLNNWYKLSLGNKRNLIVQCGNKTMEEKSDYNSFSSNNNIIDLYNRDVFKKKKMLVTSLYKNKFWEYFDNKNAPKYFKYDMSKTLLSNKKRFEYSVFDRRFSKNFLSVPKKRDRYSTFLNLKRKDKNKINIKNKKFSARINTIKTPELIKIIPLRHKKIIFENLMKK